MGTSTFLSLRKIAACLLASAFLSGLTGAGVAPRAAEARAPAVEAEAATNADKTGAEAADAATTPTAPEDAAKKDEAKAEPSGQAATGDGEAESANADNNADKKQEPASAENGDGKKEKKADDKPTTDEDGKTDASGDASGETSDAKPDGGKTGKRGKDAKDGKGKKALTREEADAAFQSAMARDWSGRVVVVPIHGPIARSGEDKESPSLPTDALAAIDKAEKDGAKLLIIDVDSPGGSVDVCSELALKLANATVPTTALVTHMAISGGAMVSLGCEKIVMCDGSRIGDIQPMMYAMENFQLKHVEMTPAVREKIETDLRASLRTIARKRNRPVELTDAMVTRDIELYRVTFENGDVRYFDQKGFDLLQKEIADGRETRKVKENRHVSPAGRLLTLTADEALEFAIADRLTKDKESFFKEEGIDPATVIEVTVRSEDLKLELDLDGLFSELDLPGWVRMLLLVFLVMGIAGLLVEYNTPGFGIPGVCSIIGWAGFFSILMMQDRGSWLGVLLFIIGVALLVVEIAVLPGFGIAGISGAACILVGLLLAYAPDLDGTGFDWFTVPDGATYTVATKVVGDFFLLFAGGVLGAGLVTWLFFVFGKHLPGAGALFMAETVKNGAGPVYAAGVSAEEREREEANRRSWVGQAGVAETALRPAGKVRLSSGERLDVVSDGVVIDAGTPVRVITVDDNRVVVEERAD